MNTKEILEKLKDTSRVQPWPLCSEEEKAMYTQAALAGKCKYLIGEGLWVRCAQKPAGGSNTYLIDPGYQPEPEYEKWKIRKNYSGVLFAFNTVGGSERNLFHCIQEPTFAGFELEDGSVFYEIGLVATKDYEGQKVIARFRKEQ